MDGVENNNAYSAHLKSISLYSDLFQSEGTAPEVFLNIANKAKVRENKK